MHEPDTKTKMHTTNPTTIQTKTKTPTIQRTNTKTPATLVKSLSPTNLPQKRTTQTTETSDIPPNSKTAIPQANTKEEQGANRTRETVDPTEDHNNRQKNHATNKKTLRIHCRPCSLRTSQYFTYTTISYYLLPFLPTTTHTNPQSMHNHSTTANHLFNSSTRPQLLPTTN